MRSKTIVATVAHGNGFYAAERFAKKHGLLLVVFFQDWWPDMAGVPMPFVKILDKHFLALAKSCAQGKNGDFFNVVYSGNLDLYGGMLLEALRVFKGHPTIQLQVRGSNPSWSEDAKKEMRDAGLWLDFAPRSELLAWLQSADAFLIPMVFDEKYRRRMETSFPSKLIEVAQFGKPLIVWGPEYCSAVQWGEQSDCFFNVTRCQPQELLKQIEFFFQMPHPKQKCAASSLSASAKECNPSLIQKSFQNFLKNL